MTHDFKSISLSGGSVTVAAGRLRAPTRAFQVEEKTNEWTLLCPRLTRSPGRPGREDNHDHDRTRCDPIPARRLSAY